jgi:hypothetical protein
VTPGGTEADGSSDSDSGGGAGDREGVGAATGARGLEGSWDESAPFVETAIGFGGAAADRLSSEGTGCGAGAGVSSTVECLPVVHGGIERNSSNVRTRGLQHFQPVDSSQITFYLSRCRHNSGLLSLMNEGRVRPRILSTALLPMKNNSTPTFLPLVKLWWARVIDTGFLRVLEDLSAAFMNAFLRHTERSWDCGVLILQRLSLEESRGELWATLSSTAFAAKMRTWRLKTTDFCVELSWHSPLDAAFTTTLGGVRVSRG